MEYEVRFYYSFDKLNELKDKLNDLDNLQVSERTYEKTIQFDHPNESNSFYSKEIDGRFRIRVSKNKLYSKCKLSWKKRLKDISTFEVNREEEIEINIDYNEYDNLIFIINDVLKMKKIESYERYRTIYFNDEIEIALDEYPFGLALEIENKSKELNPESVVKKWVNLLNLDINKSYKLSWDDKYSELCKEQNIKQYNNVEFGLQMPKIKE